MKIHILGNTSSYYRYIYNRKYNPISRIKFAKALINLIKRGFIGIKINEGEGGLYAIFWYISNQEKTFGEYIERYYDNPNPFIRKSIEFLIYCLNNNLLRLFDKYDSLEMYYGRKSVSRIWFRLPFESKVKLIEIYRLRNVVSRDYQHDFYHNVTNMISKELRLFYTYEPIYRKCIYCGKIAYFHNIQRSPICETCKEYQGGKCKQCKFSKERYRPPETASPIPDCMEIDDPEIFRYTGLHWTECIKRDHYGKISGKALKEGGYGYSCWHVSPPKRALCFEQKIETN
jgi:hypothetical protein